MKNKVKKIREDIEGEGITLEKLSKLAKVSVTTIHKFFKGELPKKRVTLGKIVKAINNVLGQKFTIEDFI